jgi:uncharacterized YigZ family protein
MSTPDSGNHFYFTIEKSAVSEFTDRGSRFLGFAFPVSSADQFKKEKARIKELHPKAVHHCFAYRMGLDGNNFRAGDDGEPSGSAGRPILGQIDSLELTNLAVVVVRYFGGQLLGVPGLINAYKTTAASALRNCERVKKPVLVNYILQFDYTVMNDVMLVLKKFQCEIFGREIQLFCRITTGIPRVSQEEVLQKLKNLHQVEVSQC